MPSKEAFLFVSCNGETGRSVTSMDHLKRQHAQIGNKSSQSTREGASGLSAPRLPLPIQIKFRPANDPNRVERYVGRCAHCKKRRKLTRWTGRCEPCDKHHYALRPQSQAITCTTSELAYGPAIPRAACPTATPLATVICDIPCGGWDCRQADLESMQYFFHYAAVDLSGYILSDFWKGSVMQASKSDSMVRQAAVAISRAHMDRCSGTGIVSAASLALYQASINMLRKYMMHTDEPSPELVLLCCVLLFTFDRLRGDEKAATIHLQSAFSILTNHRRLIANGSTLTHLLLRMDVLDITYVAVRKNVSDTMMRVGKGLLLELPMDSPEAVADEMPSMTFRTPPDFREAWMEAVHAIFAYIGKNAMYRHAPADEIPPSVLKHGRDLQRWIKAWRTAHKDYLRRNGMPDAGDLRATSNSSERIIDTINALIHASHYFVMKSVLAEFLPPLPGVDVDPWDRVAEKMLQCGESTLALRRTHRNLNSTGTRKTFPMHVGISEPLLCLSHRTTSPTVRSRAQQLLVEGFRDVSGDLTGMPAFFAGKGAPPQDLVLVYEKPGH